MPVVLVALAISLALSACSQETNEKLAAELAPYAAEAAAAALVWLAGWGARWMAAHTKNANIQTGIARLNDAVNVAVRAVEQTTVAAIKAQTGDGRLSPSEGRIVADQAIEAVKSHFGPKDLIELAKHMGVNDVTDLVRLRVEAAVQNMRAPDASPAPVAGVSTPAVAVVASGVQVPYASAPAAVDAIEALHRAAHRTR